MRRLYLILLGFMLLASGGAAAQAPQGAPARNSQDSNGKSNPAGTGSGTMGSAAGNAAGDGATNAATSKAKPEMQAQTAGAAAGSGNAALEALGRFARRFGLDRQKSAHLFVIDFSGSMLWPPAKGAKGPAPKPRKGQPPAPTRWDVLLGALPTLLDAIPEGDWVWVIGFHEKVVEDSAWVFSAWQGAKSRDFLIQSLRTQKDFGNWTNVGLALRRAKEILKNAGPRIQNVYLLTDGLHDVPETDEFFDRKSKAWTSLAADWEGLFRDASRTLLFSMYGLFDVADFRDVRSVIPKVKFLAFSGAGDLNLVFREQVDTALSNRVAAFLEREREKGTVRLQIPDVRLDYTKGEKRFTLVLESAFSTLPVQGRIRLETVKKPEDPEFGMQLETDSFRLEPGQKMEVGIRVQARVPSATFFAHKTEEVAFAVTVSDLVLEPEADFNAAGLASLRSVPNAPAAAQGRLILEMHYGRWPHYYKTIAMALAILLALLVLYAIWRMRPRRVRGHLEWLTKPAQWPHGEKTPFEGRGSARVGSASTCQARLEAFPALFLAIHDRPAGIFGRRIVMEVGCSGISRNGSTLSSGRAYPVASSAIYEYEDAQGRKIEFKIVLRK